VADAPEFQRLQRAFAAHIRDPANNEAPAGIEDRRMAIYRDLFFNNLLKLLGNTFPVLRKLHTPERWRGLIRQFMVQHRAQTPYFLEISREFLDFLEHEYEADEDDLPFLLELAHYEWAELALSVSGETNDGLDADPAADLLDGVPVKSRLARLYAYRYPVHRISTGFQPAEPDDQPTWLVLCRRADDEVSFLELNPVTARLLEMIGANDVATGRELLQSLAREIAWPDPDALIEHGHAAMREFLDAEILTGARRSR